MHSVLWRLTGRDCSRTLGSNRKWCHAWLMITALSRSQDFLVDGYFLSPPIKRQYHSHHGPCWRLGSWHPPRWWQHRGIIMHPPFSSPHHHLSGRPSLTHFGSHSKSLPDSDGSKKHDPIRGSSSSDPRQVILSRISNSNSNKVAEVNDHDHDENMDLPILTATLDWVQNVVIGMNFCPFAERPFQSQTLYLHVLHGSDETELLAQILAECLVRQHRPGTSLMICPDLHPTNFRTFLQVYNIMNEGVLVDYSSKDEENDNRNDNIHDSNDSNDNDDDKSILSEDIQIAPFHPFFEFDGSGRDGVDNYTNRSPYPMFHILREEEVGHAVDMLEGDASRVWRRNVELLEALGEEFDDDTLRVIMSGKMTTDSTIRDRVREIYKTFKRKPTDE